VIGGLGVVAAGIGVGFFVDAQNTVTDNRGCTMSCDQIREDISDSRAIGAAFAVAGGVATGVSLIWLLTRRNTPSRSLTSLRSSIGGISVSF
jgi:hypothetical protein